MKCLIVSKMSVSIKFGGSSKELTEVMCMLFILLDISPFHTATSNLTAKAQQRHWQAEQVTCLPGKGPG